MQENYILLHVIPCIPPVISIVAIIERMKKKQSSLKTKTQVAEYSNRVPERLVEIDAKRVIVYESALGEKDKEISDLEVSIHYENTTALHIEIIGASLSETCFREFGRKFEHKDMILAQFFFSKTIASL